ncbi:MAG: MFS transporter, partial [Planctomycetes bacterium]|nr:MFS transporter [Planctomycetota bacterium]
MDSGSSKDAGGIEPPNQLSSRGRYLILATAFLGWMCAGMQMINFPLATGSIVRDLHGKVLAEDSQLSQKERKEQINIKVGQWFGYYVVAFLLGAASGGLIFGWMGDRIGRAKTMGLSILCYSLLHGLAYFTPFSSSLQTLLLLRFLACFGVGGMWPTGVALVSEAWTNASRPFLAGLIGTSANV